MRYEKIDVKNELPTEQDNYFILCGNRQAFRFFNGKRFETASYEGEVTHWLKPIPDESEGTGEVDFVGIVNKIRNVPLFIDALKCFDDAIHQDRRNRAEVVLPTLSDQLVCASKHFQVANGESDIYQKGWNEAIEKLKQLNPDVKFKEGV